MANYKINGSGPQMDRIRTIDKKFRNMRRNKNKNCVK